MDDRPRAIKALVKNGARWGTKVIYVESPADRPLPLNERLRKNLIKIEEGILLVDGDSVLDFPIPEKLKKTTSFIAKSGVLLPVVFCTNADLQRLAAEGNFRKDLLDRLAFDVITVPPLRERVEDIMPLAHAFAINMASELKWSYFPGFSSRISSALLPKPDPSLIPNSIGLTIR